VAAQGYRTVPHTADLRIEAWAESRDECVAETLRGLMASFADISDVRPARILERLMTAGSDADLLASATDEVIYILDVEGEIPVSVQVRPATEASSSSWRLPGLRSWRSPVPFPRPSPSTGCAASRMPPTAGQPA